MDSFSVWRNRSSDGPNHFPEYYPIALEPEQLRPEHIVKLTYTFWKPIDIPIDFTVEVQER